MYYKINLYLFNYWRKLRVFITVKSGNISQIYIYFSIFYWEGGLSLDYDLRGNILFLNEDKFSHLNDNFLIWILFNVNRTITSLLEKIKTSREWNVIIQTNARSGLYITNKCTPVSARKIIKSKPKKKKNQRK